uniref:Uncharacterized protein n=1 Tax=Ascaris lumbricoides TaxID=6252 RepID=A0A0M3HM66_ASCLU
MALNKWKLDATTGGSRIVSRVVDACFNPPGFSQSVSVVQQDRFLQTVCRKAVMDAAMVKRVIEVKYMHVIRLLRSAICVRGYGYNFWSSPLFSLTLLSTLSPFATSLLPFEPMEFRGSSSGLCE